MNGKDDFTHPGTVAGRPQRISVLYLRLRAEYAGEQK
jgi:hypothetical protein